MTEEIKKKLIRFPQETFTKDEIINLVQEIEDQEVVESMGFKLDKNSYQIEHNSTSYKVPKKQFMLFRYLVINKNRIVQREELLNKVWGSDIIVGERTIDVHIRKLREVFPKNHFTTQMGIGYGWNEKNKAI